jgi:hypothetical protein
MSVLPVVVGVEGRHDRLPPVLLTHGRVRARALLHLPRVHPDDAEDVLEDARLEHGLELRCRLVGASLRQRRGRPADEDVGDVRLPTGLAGTADGDRRLCDVGITTVDPLAASLDGLTRVLLQAAVEGVDVGLREPEPLVHGPRHCLDGRVDGGRAVVGVLDREEQLLALDATARGTCARPAARPELEDVGLALKRDVDGDPVPGVVAHGG